MINLCATCAQIINVAGKSLAPSLWQYKSNHDYKRSQQIARNKFDTLRIWKPIRQIGRRAIEENLLRTAQWQCGVNGGTEWGDYNQTKPWERETHRYCDEMTPTSGYLR